MIVTSSVWENLFYVGSLAIRLAKKQKQKQNPQKKQQHSVGCTKIRTDILLADLVCFESQCLPRSAHLKIFLIFVILMTLFQICLYILFSLFFFFTSASSCLSSSLLPSSFIIIYFSCTWRRQFFVESACVSLLPCVSSYRWIDLFYQFCQPHQQLFTHSSEKGCFLSYSWNHTGGCVVY